MDIPLQEEEDSSDEEYCPDEDEEDETAEEVHITYNIIFNTKNIKYMYILGMGHDFRIFD